MNYILCSFFKVDCQSLCCLNYYQVIHLRITRPHLTTQSCCSKLQSRQQQFSQLGYIFGQVKGIYFFSCLLILWNRDLLNYLFIVIFSISSPYKISRHWTDGSSVVPTQQICVDDDDDGNKNNVVLNRSWGSHSAGSIIRLMSTECVLITLVLEAARTSETLVISTILHGARTQKPAMGTSNPTQLNPVRIFTPDFSYTRSNIVLIIFHARTIDWMCLDMYTDR